MIIYKFIQIFNHYNYKEALVINKNRKRNRNDNTIRKNKRNKIIIAIIASITVFAIVFSTTLFSNFFGVFNDESSNIKKPDNNATQQVMVEEEKRVSFIGVGDNLIHNIVYEDALTKDGIYDFKPMYSEFEDLIKGKDLAFINQESVIAGDDRGLSSYPTFNTPEAMAQNLVDVGFDIISNANNHILDKGAKGAIRTLEIWGEKEVTIDGAFLSQEDSEKVPVVESNGMKIAYLAYTYGTNGIKPDTDWRVRYLNEEKIRKDIAKAKEISDFILVSAHWGDEYNFGITDYQKKYAKLFNDLGVDVVLGTHTHVVGPVEELVNDVGEKTLVIYSTANFLSGQVSNIDCMLGQIATFDFVKKGQNKKIENIKMIPTITYSEGNVTGGTDFKVINLENYTEEMA